MLAVILPVLPPLSVGKMTLRLYSALNYSHGLSKGPSFGTGRGGGWCSLEPSGLGKRWSSFWWKSSEREVRGDLGILRLLRPIYGSFSSFAMLFYALSGFNHGTNVVLSYFSTVI